MKSKYFNTLLKKYNHGKERNYRIICFEKSIYKGKKEAKDIKNNRDYKEEAKKRAKRMIKDKIRNNYNRNFKFITLTYRIKNFDRERINSDLKNLADEIRRFYKQYKYVAVPEKHQDGSWHIHMIAEIPYIPNGKNVTQRKDGRTWAKLWDGFVKVNSIKNMTGALEYMMKYVFKQIQNNDRYKHVYMISRNWNYDYESEYWIRNDMNEVKDIVLRIEERLKSRANIFEINGDDIGNILIFDFYKKEGENGRISGT